MSDETTNRVETAPAMSAGAVGLPSGAAPGLIADRVRVAVERDPTIVVDGVVRTLPATVTSRIDGWTGTAVHKLPDGRVLGCWDSLTSFALPERYLTLTRIPSRMDVADGGSLLREPDAHLRYGNGAVPGWCDLDGSWWSPRPQGVESPYGLLSGEELDRHEQDLVTQLSAVRAYRTAPGRTGEDEQPNETIEGQRWRIAVEVPLSVDLDARHELFAAVVAAVKQWEADCVDPIADVYGHPVPAGGTDWQRLQGLIADELKLAHDGEGYEPEGVAHAIVNTIRFGDEYPDRVPSADQQVAAVAVRDGSMPAVMPDGVLYERGQNG